MPGFKRREGDFAITVSNGVYKQVDVYEREGLLYAKEGSGFVQLIYDGSTTKSKTRLDLLSVETPLAMSWTGRICIAGTEFVSGQKPLEEYAEKLGLPAPETTKRLG